MGRRGRSGAGVVKVTEIAYNQEAAVCPIVVFNVLGLVRSSEALNLYRCFVALVLECPFSARVRTRGLTTLQQRLSHVRQSLGVTSRIEGCVALVELRLKLNVRPACPNASPEEVTVQPDEQCLEDGCESGVCNSCDAFRCHAALFWMKSQGTVPHDSLVESVYSAGGCSLSNFM